MIRQVSIENFKSFRNLDFAIPDLVVFAGPNSSGKSTILEAIAFWSEICTLWIESGADFAKNEHGNYNGVDLNLLRVNSISLATFDHLWTSRVTRDPVMVELHTSRWRVAFEIIYNNAEWATVRPRQDVSEDDLDAMRDDPMRVSYVQPFSGLSREEPAYHVKHIEGQMLRGVGGRILKNLVAELGSDRETWEELKRVVASWFGYEILMPSRGRTVFARYRQTQEELGYDLSSGASGFLQVLGVYASLLYKKSSVILLDEPDPDLHILLQERMYRDLRKLARQRGAQLIVATHSEVVIRASKASDLRVITADGNEIREAKDNKHVLRTLRIDSVDFVLCNTEPGILFLEGDSDLSILREWARVLRHRLLDFLERPFWKPIAERPDRNRFSRKEYSALKMVAPHGFSAVELRDSDGDVTRPTVVTENLPGGFVRLYWMRKEIENYLLHKPFLTRFLERRCSEDGVRRAVRHIGQWWPPALVENAFVDGSPVRTMDGKKELGNLLTEAGLELEGEYHLLAREMQADEINPEVGEKMDLIADALGLESRDCGSHGETG